MKVPWEELRLLWWLPVLQSFGQGGNSLRKFYKVEIHPCLSLHEALLPVLLKSVCNVFKVYKINTMMAKFKEAKNMVSEGCLLIHCSQDFVPKILTVVFFFFLVL